MKLESILKEEPEFFIKDVKSRAIVWQAKGICAIFSPIFLQVKERLKRILRKQVKYVDGMTPKQVNDWLHKQDTDQTNWIYESDLS